jgi:hypothetical protein
MRKFLLAGCILLLGSAAHAQAPTTDPFGGPAPAELNDVLQNPPTDGPAPRRFTFAQLVLGAQEEGEHQPPPDPHDKPGHRDMQFQPEEVVAVPARFEQPFVASNSCGIIVLVAGVLGWVGLGLAVLVVEYQQTKPK